MNDDEKLNGNKNENGKEQPKGLSLSEIVEQLHRKNFHPSET